MPAVASSAHQIAPGVHPKRGQEPAHHRETHGNFRFSARYFPQISATTRTQTCAMLPGSRKDPWPCRMRDSLSHALRGGPRGEEARSRRGMSRKASRPGPTRYARSLRGAGQRRARTTGQRRPACDRENGHRSDGRDGREDLSIPRRNVENRAVLGPERGPLDREQ